MAFTSPLAFSVRRKEPQLIVPTKPTPRELKALSDIDDQEGLRFQVPVIMFYKSDSINPPLSPRRRDPVKVIRQALAQALVFYYPFAGRIVEGPNRKLVVDCTGEGVLFIEADADIKLEQLGDTIWPPFAFTEEILYDVPGSSGICGCPLMLIQVTRLVCGGFVFAMRTNHTMTDGPGLMQFLNAVGELAKGAPSPSLLPVWQRHILNARSPPRIKYHHPEFDEQNLKQIKTDNDGDGHDDEKTNVKQSFFFGPKEMAALRNHLPLHLRDKTTAFELVTACLWRCRTSALRLDPGEKALVSCIVNARGKRGLNIPPGYYGNAFAYPAAVSEAGVLCTSPLEYAVELVKKAKGQMNMEYLKSVADLMVMKGRPLYTTVGNFIVSDNTRHGFHEVDFGWGKAVYGGVPTAYPLLSFCGGCKNSRGEDGMLVPLCLPLAAMERFREELERMTREWVEDSCATTPRGPKIPSML